METADKPNSPEQTPVKESYDINACFDNIDGLSIDFKGKTILELGSGRGFHTEFLLKKQPKMIVAVKDYNVNYDFLMDKFKNIKEVVPVYYDLEIRIPRLEKHYDWIYSYGLLNSIKDPIQFIRNIKSIPHDNMLLGVDTTFLIDLRDILDELNKIYKEKETIQVNNNHTLILCTKKK